MWAMCRKTGRAARIGIRGGRPSSGRPLPRARPRRLAQSEPAGIRAAFGRPVVPEVNMITASSAAIGSTLLDDVHVGVAVAGDDEGGGADLLEPPLRLAVGHEVADGDDGRARLPHAVHGGEGATSLATRTPTRAPEGTERATSAARAWSAAKVVSLPSGSTTAMASGCSPAMPEEQLDGAVRFS